MKQSFAISGRLVVAVITVALLASPPVAAAERSADQQPGAHAVPDAGVVAFYFHGNVRCATCRKIEAYADEAIHSAFPAELEDGALMWRTVNIDEPENEHFIEDFKLTTRSVVLAEFRDGKVVRFEKLDEIWRLVRSQERFTEYVQSETRDFLGSS